MQLNIYTGRGHNKWSALHYLICTQSTLRYCSSQTHTHDNDDTAAMEVTGLTHLEQLGVQCLALINLTWGLALPLTTTTPISHDTRETSNWKKKVENLMEIHHCCLFQVLSSSPHTVLFCSATICCLSNKTQPFTKHNKTENMATKQKTEQWNRKHNI